MLDDCWRLKCRLVLEEVDEEAVGVKAEVFVVADTHKALGPAGGLRLTVSAQGVAS
jgi:hypothetical protein